MHPRTWDPFLNCLALQYGTGHGGGLTWESSIREHPRSGLEQVQGRLKIDIDIEHKYPWVNEVKPSAAK